MRRHWAVAVFIGLVVALPSRGVQEAKQLVLKVLVPEDEAEILVDGKMIEGEGKERRIPLTEPAKDKKNYIVTGKWEPNNYTKFTRTRKVKADATGLVTVDLTKAYDTEKIKIRWVPTPEDVAGRMCQLAKVTKKDVVYDIGCGDGIMVFHAVEKFGAKRGVGIDIDRDLLKKCTDKAKERKVEDRVEFKYGDALEIKDVSDADVVLLYMGDDVNLRLRPALQKTLKPGSRVVSHRFTMGDWRPTRTETFTGDDGDEYTIHLWVIEGRKKE
jgi:protein-L-isoaspartate O-methyltransferase